MTDFRVKRNFLLLKKSYQIKMFFLSSNYFEVWLDYKKDKTEKKNSKEQIEKKRVKDKVMKFWERKRMKVQLRERERALLIKMVH